MKNNKFILAVAALSTLLLASCAAVFEDLPVETPPVNNGSTTEPVGTSTLPAGTTTDVTANATTTPASPVQQTPPVAPAEGTTSATGSSTPVENAPTLGSTSAQL